jgi:hypothetical protein
VGNFSDPISPSRVVGTGHRDLASNSAHRVGNPVIIRRNQDPSQTPDAACLFVDMLDYWLATQQRQRLAWETSRPVPRWNESDNFQFRFDLLFNLLRSVRFVATPLALLRGKPMIQVSISYGV